VTIRPREFITLFGGTVVAWQRFAWAEQRRLVGVLWTDRSAVESFSFDAALRRGFAEAGFIEGSNIAPSPNAMPVATWPVSLASFRPSNPT
jgi:hypothetical protein